MKRILAMLTVGAFLFTLPALVKAEEGSGDNLERRGQAIERRGERTENRGDRIENRAKGWKTVATGSTEGPTPLRRKARTGRPRGSSAGPTASTGEATGSKDGARE